MSISSAKCLELFIYDEETGELRLRRSTREKKPGWLATQEHGRSYLTVEIEGKQYRAHRIIWLMKTGYEPDEIDHINHIRSDNRWCNLRNVSSREQKLNLSRYKTNTSGATGVRCVKNRFQARIYINKKDIVLGTFSTFDEALAARKAAEIQYGFHTNHGQPKT